METNNSVLSNVFLTLIVNENPEISPPRGNLKLVVSDDCFGNNMIVESFNEEKASSF